MRTYLTFTKNELTIMPAAQDSGFETTIEVEFDHEAEVAFNGLYLVDVLKACDGDTVDLYFNSMTAPARFIGSDRGDVVLMPVRTAKTMAVK